MEKGTPAFAGAVPPALRRSGALQRTASSSSSASSSNSQEQEAVCTCTLPIVPGWPDATITIACIDTAGFWQTVSHPCVLRLMATADMSPEEAIVAGAGYFIFLVRPGREDADVKGLTDVLQRQGSVIPGVGKPVDFSGAGKTWMQIVAVLAEDKEE